MSHKMPLKILPNYVRTGIIFVEFTTLVVFTEQGCQPRLQLPNLENKAPIFISPGAVPQLYPPGTGIPFRRLVRLVGVLG
jgi:hypothetical protein